MSSLYSIDLLKELSDGFEQDGYTTDDVKAIRSHGRLTAFLGVLRGTHEIRPFERVIDFSAPCKLPFNGAERVSPAKSGIVKLERRGESLYLDGMKLELALSENQKGGKVIGGHDLRKEREAAGGNVSASILDKCVENPALWPESWKKDAQGNTIYVFFWDDIFRRSHGDLYVRYGYWSEGRVVSHCFWLDYDWDRRNPSASLAS